MAAPSKGERAFKGEKVKRGKGERMAAPSKGERVKRRLAYQLAYLSTCQLVNLSTRQLVNSSTDKPLVNLSSHQYNNGIFEKTR